MSDNYWDCNVCGDVGFIKEPASRWTRGIGYEYLPCPACETNVARTDVVCPACDGSGMNIIRWIDNTIEGTICPVCDGEGDLILGAQNILHNYHCYPMRTAHE